MNMKEYENWNSFYGGSGYLYKATINTNSTAQQKLVWRTARRHLVLGLSFRRRPHVKTCWMSFVL